MYFPDTRQRRSQKYRIMLPKKIHCVAEDKPSGGVFSRFWAFINNSRIIVACFSTLIFGVVLSYCGARFQHQFWLEGDSIARYRNKVQKIEDKRIDLLARMFTILGKVEQELWNLFSETYGYRSAKRLNDEKEMRTRVETLAVHRHSLQVINTDLNTLALENRIFWPVEAESVLNGELQKFWEKAHFIVLEESNWEKQGSTMEEFNLKMNELGSIRLGIQQILTRAVIPGRE